MCDRPQRGELGRGVGVAEEVEGPVVHGPAAKVGVLEAAPVEGLQGDWLDACLLLLWPAEGPGRHDAAQRRCGDAGSGDGAGAEQQGVVHLGEGLPGVGVEEADGGGEEAFLVGPGDRAVAVGAVAQVGEVPQQPSQVCRRLVDLAVKCGGHDLHLITRV